MKLTQDQISQINLFSVQLSDIDIFVTSQPIPKNDFERNRYQKILDLSQQLYEELQSYKEK